MGRNRLVLAAILASTACGDNTAQPDAVPAPPGPICGTPVATIAAFPGEYTGVTLGAGADLGVASGACIDERLHFGTTGEDQVIEVVGMTPGVYYAIELETDDDLAFYVTTACDQPGPAAGACLLYVDLTVTQGEVGELLAPADGRFAIIIDSANDPVPDTGAYTLRVKRAECVPGPFECTDPVRTICDDYACVECADDFDCRTAAPVCDPTGTCAAGPDQCTGDDLAEPDDGPTAAQVITAVPPTDGNPTQIDRAICSLPIDELDWYTFDLAAPASIRFEVAWADATADLDLQLGNAAGILIAQAAHDGPGPEAVTADLAAGTYYVLVQKFTPIEIAAATPYTLTLSVPDCDTSFDCLSPAAPYCFAGACSVGPAQCTGDDAADAGGSDDGPAGARIATAAVGVPQVFTGATCDEPRDEVDYFAVTVGEGEGIVVDVAFDVAIDFDLDVFSSTGTLLGRSWWLDPEVVTLTYLPSGTYYVRLVEHSGMFGGDPAAQPYTLSITRTIAQVCATRADCAAEHRTQIYRGRCSGSCDFIPAGTRALDTPCDSGDDCDSSLCAYAPFEADADRAVCTDICSTTADCTAVGAGLTCTDGFSTNVCAPSCTASVDCGANQGNPTVDPGEAWDYFTCTPATGVCSAP